MVSASLAQSDILGALKVGAHGYIPKSVGVSGMREALTLVLDGLVFVPPQVTDTPEPSRERDDVSTDAVVAPTVTLSRRQTEVLACLERGLSNKEIGRTLGLGEGTIKIHMAALFRALGVRNRAQAAAHSARKKQDPT